MPTTEMNGEIRLARQTFGDRLDKVLGRESAVASNLKTDRNLHPVFEHDVGVIRDLRMAPAHFVRVELAV